MRSTKILGALALLLTLVSSCKKDDVTNPSNPVTVNPDGSINAADGAGFFYSIHTRYFETNSSSNYDDTQFAMALVGSFPNLVDAGAIKVNNIELDNWANYYVATADLASGESLFNTSTGKVDWNIAGNPAESVPAFTHSDNEALPSAPTFTLPSSLSINSSLTITHPSTGGNIGVAYTISGVNGDTTKFVQNLSSSMTFTSAEIKSVATTDSDISVSVMPLSYSTGSYGGKKYYFVKQHQYIRPTRIQ